MYRMYSTINATKHCGALYRSQLLWQTGLRNRKAQVPSLASIFHALESNALSLCVFLPHRFTPPGTPSLCLIAF